MCKNEWMNVFKNIKVSKNCTYICTYVETPKNISRTNIFRLFSFVFFLLLNLFSFDIDYTLFAIISQSHQPALCWIEIRFGSQCLHGQDDQTQTAVKSSICSYLHIHTYFYVFVNITWIYSHRIATI